MSTRRYNNRLQSAYRLSKAKRFSSPGINTLSLILPFIISLILVESLGEMRKVFCRAVRILNWPYAIGRAGGGRLHCFRVDRLIGPRSQSVGRKQSAQ